MYLCETFHQLDSNTYNHGHKCQTGSNDEQRDQLGTVQYPVGWRKRIIDEGIACKPVALQGFAGIEHNDEEYKERKAICKNGQKRYRSRKIRYAKVPVAEPEHETQEYAAGADDDPEIVIADDIEQFQLEQAPQGSFIVSP
jgi:hypothetical protein